MAVVSFLQLILLLVLLICCIIGQVEGSFARQRRQTVGGNNRDIGFPPRNSDGSILTNNANFNPPNNPNMIISNDRNNQQQSNNNLLAAPQGQPVVVRSRGFYDSPAFKSSSFSGEKPVGWFDTKYANWVSDQNTELDKNNNMVAGKNGAPSSLQGKAIQPRSEDSGPLLLQKFADQAMSRGEKSYTFDQSYDQKKLDNVCSNRHNFNGYKFDRFQCPLPTASGMHRNNRFCCGPVNYQYCCNEQEFYQNQNQEYDYNNNHGKNRHPHHLHHSNTTRRILAVVLPIVGILVVAAVAIIVILYYKKLRNTQNNQSKSSGVNKLSDNYSAVPQDPPVENTITNQREQHKSSIQT
ncbi:unnamed protein product [Rotaria magnacalcarata]|uniref:Shisa N-terminal domain-containing protein n=1 Tax=Rotaria magnacalcarata TaxID=392030 RepID=A0A815WAQ7_9BILA|nr:unnamed protein product [Rotaria magnacalcarata]CAF1683046.1 unnamed protein product [Rotaria magnacalcarata]CAF2132177.1 unnamed protein product [Rotaria magnacalcarata]CAF2135625.1 unnamed protein product [Rotaria magnacalcarata]CAF2232328.1 unnamed protein product [Rotaria magnacalcarata]